MINQMTNKACEYVIVRIDGYDLKRTCSSCPEQYEVFKDGQEVGYLRLRHGYFSAHHLGPGGPVVYDAFPEGDGRFQDDEREFHLRNAIAAIAKARADHAS